MIAAFIPVAIYTLKIVEFFIMTDELAYAKQAIQISETGWLVLPGDFYFTSWAQLLPTLMAPALRLLNMPNAFNAVHILNAAVMASIAVPVYLLVHEFLDWRPAAYLAAALSIAIPWMAMAATMMTEVVAYPVFVWAVLAMQRAIAAPSTRRDLLALIALGVAYFARTQFIFLAPALLVSVVLHEVTFRAEKRQPTTVLRSVWFGLKRSVNDHPVLLAATGAVAVVILLLEIKGSPAVLLGNYLAPVRGDLIPPGASRTAAENVGYIAVAIGIMPLILSAAWVAVTLLRPADKKRHAFAVLLTVVALMLAILVGSFTERFAVSINDRYLFYVAPLLFAGMVLCLLDDRRALFAIPVAGVGVAYLVSILHLGQSVPSVVSPSFTFHRVLDGQASQIGNALSIEDLNPATLIAAATIVISLAVTLAFRAWSGRLMLALIGIPILAYSTIETSYSLIKIADTNKGASQEWLDSRNWIDKAVQSDARVGVVLAPLGENTVGVWWDTSFWNKTVDRSFVLPGGDSFDQLFVKGIELDPESSRLSGFDEVSYLVMASTDMRIRLKGSRIVAQNAGLDLVRASRPYTAAWATLGLDKMGRIPVGKAAQVRFYSDDIARPTTRRARIKLAAAAEANHPCRYRIVTRTERRSGQILPGSSVNRKIRIRVPADGFAEVRIDAITPGKVANRCMSGIQVVGISLAGIKET